MILKYFFHISTENWTNFWHSSLHFYSDSINSRQDKGFHGPKQVFFFYFQKVFFIKPFCSYFILKFPQLVSFLITKYLYFCVKSLQNTLMKMPAVKRQHGNLVRRQHGNLSVLLLHYRHHHLM